MIEVRMNTLYAGPNGNCHPGGKITVDDDEAKALVDGKYAVYVESLDTESEDENVDSEEDFHSEIMLISSGLYELPNGDQVKGKAKALAAYKAMQTTE